MSNGTNGTLTAVGDTSEFQVSGGLHVHVSGTFGGGSIKLQAKGPDTLWHDIADAVWTAAADQAVFFPDKSVTQVRLSLTGGAGHALYWWLQGGGS